MSSTLGADACRFTEAARIMRECHDLGMESRTTPDGYWPLVSFALAGIVGGAAGALFAGMGLDSWPFPEYHPAFAPARLLVASAAVVGGVLAGWFLAILVFSWAPGQSRCPRCGTPTGEASAHAWHACCPSPMIEGKATRPKSGSIRMRSSSARGARPSAPERGLEHVRQRTP